LQTADGFKEEQMVAGQVRVREVGRMHWVCQQLSHRSCLVRGLVSTFIALSSTRLWCKWLRNQIFVLAAGAYSYLKT